MIYFAIGRTQLFRNHAVNPNYPEKVNEVKSCIYCTTAPLPFPPNSGLGLTEAPSSLWWRPSPACTSLSCSSCKQPQADSLCPALYATPSGSVSFLATWTCPILGSEPCPKKKRKTRTKKWKGPGWCGSVDWTPACKLKGYQFDSWSQYMPGLQARSLAGDEFLFLPSPLSKNK